MIHYLAVAARPEALAHHSSGMDIVPAASVLAAWDTAGNSELPGMVRTAVGYIEPWVTSTSRSVHQ